MPSLLVYCIRQRQYISHHEHRCVPKTKQRHAPHPLRDATRLSTPCKSPRKSDQPHEATPTTLPTLCAMPNGPDETRGCAYEKNTVDTVDTPIYSDYIYTGHVHMQKKRTSCEYASRSPCTETPSTCRGVDRGVTYTLPDPPAPTAVSLGVKLCPPSLLAWWGGGQKYSSSSRPNDTERTYGRDKGRVKTLEDRYRFVLFYKSYQDYSRPMTKQAARQTGTAFSGVGHREPVKDITVPCLQGSTR